MSGSWRSDDDAGDNDLELNASARNDDEEDNDLELNASARNDDEEDNDLELNASARNDDEEDDDLELNKSARSNSQPEAEAEEEEQYDDESYGSESFTAASEIPYSEADDDDEEREAAESAREADVDEEEAVESQGNEVRSTSKGSHDVDEIVQDHSDNSRQDIDNSSYGIADAPAESSNATCHGTVEEHEAALKLQKIARGRNARKACKEMQIKSVKNMVGKEGAHAACASEREADKHVNDTIEERGHLYTFNTNCDISRQETHDVSVGKKHRAAVFIQKVARGNRERKRVAERRQAAVAAGTTLKPTLSLEEASCVDSEPLLSQSRASPAEDHQSLNLPFDTEGNNADDPTLAAQMACRRSDSKDLNSLATLDVLGAELSRPATRRSDRNTPSSNGRRSHGGDLDRDSRHDQGADQSPKAANNSVDALAASWGLFYDPSSCICPKISERASTEGSRDPCADVFEEGSVCGKAHELDWLGETSCRGAAERKSRQSYLGPLDFARGGLRDVATQQTEATQHSAGMSTVIFGEVRDSKADDRDGSAPVCRFVRQRGVQTQEVEVAKSAGGSRADEANAMPASAFDAPSNGAQPVHFDVVLPGSASEAPQRHEASVLASRSISVRRPPGQPQRRPRPQPCPRIQLAPATSKAAVMAHANALYGQGGGELSAEVEGVSALFSETWLTQWPSSSCSKRSAFTSSRMPAAASTSQDVEFGLGSKFRRTFDPVYATPRRVAARSVDSSIQRFGSRLSSIVQL
eukprot:TRINITY_DN242_c0_g2_i5.p1 TRINITY_DN242_c0_g2~~TRINITY_DN242_c0_g2_i5.p1  ORF type:complete len:756 (-),score=131.27 TRINITY_DN242_c0_g2_i5:482-2749(-)